MGQCRAIEVSSYFSYSLQKYIFSLFLDSHVVIIVYNVSSSADDNRVAEWIHEADKHAPAEALKILIGNKVDLI